MGILIGGSSSTGSSLLRTILNRHSAIFSGAELNFFNKRKLYTDWSSYKHQCLNNTLVTDGWQPMKGTNLLNKDYLWSKNEVKTLLHDSANMNEFTQKYFSRALQNKKAEVWVEKTPSDAYCFNEFLSEFPEGKVIHITRNPYDTVSSLIKRGYSIYFSCAWWMYNTAAAMSCKNSSKYHLIKYENLIQHPDATLKKLFTFMGVPFDSSISQGQQENQNEPTTMSGWKNDQTANISSSSINRFNELNQQQQDLIAFCLEHLQINKVHATKLQTNYTNATKSIHQLGYDFITTPNNGKYHVMAGYLKDRLFRIKNRLPNAWSDYPINFS